MVFFIGLVEDGLLIGLQVVSVEYNDYFIIDFVCLMVDEIGGFVVLLGFD